MAVKDWNGFRHTSNDSLTLYQGGDMSRVGGTFAVSGTLYAAPYVGPGGLLNAIRVGIASPSSGHFARVAIYTTDGTANCYPTTLVSDVGCVTAQSAGLASIMAPITLNDNTLYWRVIWISGLNAWVPCTTRVGRYPVFGHEIADGASDGGITAPYTGDIVNGAFPATFPTSGRVAHATDTPTFYLSYSGAV